MVIDRRLLREFSANGDSLRVYEDGHIIFASDKDGLLPLLEYIDMFAAGHRQVVIVDKIAGNAAALLSVLADCAKVLSPLGSRLAINTLDKYGIKHHFDAIVPYISKDESGIMCPMEKSSMGKNPEEFYEAIRKLPAREGRC